MKQKSTDSGDYPKIEMPKLADEAANSLKDG
jgi:hypothetical protein